MSTSTINDGLFDKSTYIFSKKSNNNSILEELEEMKKKKKMTTLLSSSVIAAKQAKRYVKLRRFKVITLQVEQ